MSADDLFAGCGGASTGAVDAGYEVVLAVDAKGPLPLIDADAGALAMHAANPRANHPSATHVCAALPPALPLPLPIGAV